MAQTLQRESTVQRRSSIRYKLRLPVIFHWTETIERTAGGFTVDVALDGALIRSSVCPPVGTKVKIEVLLPAPDESGEELRIECTGTVTRIVESQGMRAFGVYGFFDDDHLTRHIFSLEV